MRIFTPLLWLALVAVQPAFAEGTRELAPNESITINGNATTDIAALHINNPSYNNFAAYDNPNPQNRLYIHIKDPETECIYIGLNWAHNNVGSTMPPRINFEYRIKDPNGNIVFGPVVVTPTGANIQSWSQAYTGPQQLYGAGGYDATIVSSAALASQGWATKGDYYIEFRDFENNDLLIDFWDFTVVDCSTVTPVEKKGRVWSFNWAFFAINDFGFPNRPFNGAFFVCAPDPDNAHASFVTKIDFNGSGFRPAAFNVAFNSFGSQNTGNISEDRKSVELLNATQAEYSIFLNDPIDICETAEVGEITILGVSRCAGEDYCIKFTATKAGQIDLLLDFDGADNIYTPGTADIMVTYNVEPDQVGKPTCIDWNGKDGLGNPLPEDVGTQIPVLINFAQGIYHFPIYDAEYLTDGFRIASVRPVAAISLLYYDDSNISVLSGSGEPIVQLSGCMTPCHRWDNYTLPNTPGFGNLNTINSWWFSQLIIRQDVFFMPSYYACAIEGPSRICEGGTSELTASPEVYPAGAVGGEIINTQWIGPAIVGPSNGATITIGSGGTYTVKVQWLTHLGDTCYTSCTFDVMTDPILTATIDTIMLQGQTVTINGQTYNQGGQYLQELTTSAGCDSLLTINITVINTVLYYDLNACESFMSNGSNMDFSEFVPTYPQPVSCAQIIGETLHRTNPQVNKHSCTPGVNNTPGMCVGALPGCIYNAGSEASVIIEVHITPNPDTAVHLTGITFWEKAPLTYDWISGGSGPNNYPTLFGIRVLKNGTEIFRDDAIPTLAVWNQRTFDFLSNDEFLVKDPATFRFELLAYCPIENGAVESVWDLDEIRIMAGCTSPAGLNRNISGIILTPSGLPVRDVTLRLSEHSTFQSTQSTFTNTSGAYAFSSIVPERPYFVRAEKNTGFLNGVSTLDLVHIQKHLLGISIFSSPYQWIAADANRSNTVSVLDLVELRKLILGIYSELPNNTSWRFGVAAQAPDISAPWLFNETLSIEYLREHITDADFTAVKVGDVNGDVVPFAGGVSLTPRSGEFILLQVRDQNVTAGVPVRLDITADHFDQVAGLQMALQVSGRITSIKGAALPISDDHYFISRDGILRLSWDVAIPLTLTPDQVLFSIQVEPFSNGTVKGMIQTRNDVLHAEIYTGDELDIRDVRLQIEAGSSKTVTTQFFQNMPNPFSTTTTLRFHIEKAGQVSLNLFDLSGRSLATMAGQYEQGTHEVIFDRTKLGLQSGLMVARMQADDFVSTIRMIVLD